ncbi:hypothetical protein ERO13_A07G072100v2 [Gossypium hirsutum]|uniref:Uncharacterized protein n=5 Tax=Gossypium TaxID=3633 RepID=A0ABR0P9W8_GOSAR|nr:uncharacterized protein LOC107934215 [Gossypium hirsutum]XP_017650052.1 uncharacterized protein LOC108489864 [Gossypium arboreum]KAB1671237.1 hypothetical protein [Gossypium barbadense]TYH09301.1 hypothetical protein ES288_A07G084100v1 [Gossypium darwinii]TYJ25910.1 hypothetical protein E1A91_A07G081000v1 [Gossypium mustelinum]KAG4191124.1 hypothetical protein ERO13_A07G072100v2 [Gossypium hirsutum]KAK5817964.1 hypothetical protein PVK06_022893 [Gossypium arboreum]
MIDFLIIGTKMAVELCSDNCGISPRISFSLNLCHFDDVPVEQRPFRSKPSSLNSSVDFDFGVGETFEQEAPSADELFSDGKILPTDIKKSNPSKQIDHSSSPPPPPLPPQKAAESSKEEEKQSSKPTSFWGFKRSSSFSCGSGYGRSLCPLPLLSRSNSTGSTPNAKHPSPNNPKHIHSHKHAAANSITNPSFKSSTSYHQKPPLKKTAYKPYYGNGVHPVLNVPSGNLFGLGSIFFNGNKAKNSCKRK